MDLRSKRIRLCILIPVLLAITACGQTRIEPLSTQPGYLALDPLFGDFYSGLGGIEVLGRIISQVILEDNIRKQYTEAALLIYDPNEPEIRRFQLAPLGIQMRIVDPPVPKPDDPQALYLGGHIVCPEFVPLFQKMLGVRFVGEPLTEAIRNPTLKRTEQYFENVGFYILDEDPPNKVHLLDYGVWTCIEDCQSSPQINMAIDPGFEDYARNLGVGVTGFSLTDAYIAPDGWKEQIFQNVVVAADPMDPTQIQLRPITKKLGIKPDPYETRSDDPEVVFYPMQGEKGYNVPRYFKDYVDKRGGYIIFGEPVTSKTQTTQHTIRQCFVRICLLADAISSEVRRVYPDPLGYIYREQFYVTENAWKETNQTSDELTILTWQTQQVIGSGGQQEIWALVLDSNRVLAGVDLELTLALDMGMNQALIFPPTGKDGKTHLLLPAIIALNGTIFPYQVCVRNQDPPFCVKDSYLVWYSR